MKKNYTTKELSIEVVKGEAQQSGQQQQQGVAGGNAQSSQRSSTGEVSSKDVFLKLSFSKTKVVKGEPVIATLKLLTRTNISGVEDIKFPSFNIKILKIIIITKPFKKKKKKPSKKWDIKLLGGVLFAKMMKGGASELRANAEEVNKLNVFEDGAVVDVNIFLEKRIIRKELDGLKILGTGEITKKLTVKATVFSATAKEKIEALGGTVTVVE